MDSLAAELGQNFELVEEGIDVGAPPGADVYRYIVRSIKGEYISASDIPDVDIVTLVPAVPIDDWLLTGQHLVGEDRDHASLAGPILARPVDVAVAQTCEPQPMEALVDPQVLLRRGLTDRVGGHGLKRVLFVDREIFRRTVHRAAGCRINNFPRAVLARGLQQADSAMYIDARIVEWIVDAARHTRLRGLMDDEFGLKSREHRIQFTITQVDLREPGGRVEVLSLPGREVVDDHYFVAGIKESIDNV